ncbi:hypothetical protein L6452_40547 [Arctium lappa]|uniref:Uncharacterized protein n=1 Tax=Arctium lappa TaxID=4217 RepID=A0ACB8XMF4_ARCLA|nr:hypothetical protein L6452_40547 [Arctium lappa]
MNESPIVSLPIVVVAAAPRRSESTNKMSPPPPPPPLTAVSSASRTNNHLSHIRKGGKVIEKIMNCEIENDFLDAYEVFVSSPDSGSECNDQTHIRFLDW